MKKHTITTYSYNELNEKAKEKAHNKVEEIMTGLNFGYFEEDCLDVLKSEYDLQNVNVQYSLSYCQGDGLRFDCDNLFDSKYIKNEVFESLTIDEQKMFENLLNEVTFFSKNNNRYCFSSKNQVDFDNQCYIDDKDCNFLNEKILPQVQKIYIDICSILEKIGYQCYEISNEQFDDFIEFSQYEFLEDGTIYNN